MIGENNVDTGEIIKQTGSIIHFKGGATFLNGPPIPLLSHMLT